MLERPWARVKNPTPIPGVVTPEFLADLSDAQFAELLRDNLLPRTPDTRAQWERLWDVLVASDDLAERSFDVLEAFLQKIAELKSNPNAEEGDLKRARKFSQAIDGSWKRLEHTEQPAAAKIRKLVFAITKHRTHTRTLGQETDVDEELWRVLGRLGLDPDKRS